MMRKESRKKSKSEKKARKEPEVRNGEKRERETEKRNWPRKKKTESVLDEDLMCERYAIHTGCIKASLLVGQKGPEGADESDDERDGKDEDVDDDACA